MTIDKILDIFFTLMGLYFAIRFRYLGKTAIKQRKWLNKFFPFPNPEQDFDRVSIVVTQCTFLFIGILFFLVGLTKLFK